MIYLDVKRFERHHHAGVFQHRRHPLAAFATLAICSAIVMSVRSARSGRSVLVPKALALAIAVFTSATKVS